LDIIYLISFRCGLCRLCVTWIIHQQLWGYNVEEKLYLGVREQKKLNTTGVDGICIDILYILASSYPSRGLLHQNHRNISHHQYHCHPIFHLHLDKVHTCTDTMHSLNKIFEKPDILDLEIVVDMVGLEFHSIYYQCQYIKEGQILL
jgi:hypothetical protein